MKSSPSRVITWTASGAITLTHPFAHATSRLPSFMSMISPTHEACRSCWRMRDTNSLPSGVCAAAAAHASASAEGQLRVEIIQGSSDSDDEAPRTGESASEDMASSAPPRRSTMSPTWYEYSLFAPSSYTLTSSAGGAVVTALAVPTALGSSHRTSAVRCTESTLSTYPTRRLAYFEGCAASPSPPPSVAWPLPLAGGATSPNASRSARPRPAQCFWRTLDMTESHTS
mmetsp:Transcript_1632/g.6442  ORF Transcript_1632/g.6442 Transcript_1632/m.6442 type:complete len:228 (-) Transcript_1632:2235-2918(-)